MEDKIKWLKYKGMTLQDGDFYICKLKEKYDWKEPIERFVVAKLTAIQVFVKENLAHLHFKHNGHNYILETAIEPDLKADVHENYYYCFDVVEQIPNDSYKDTTLVVRQSPYGWKQNIVISDREKQQKITSFCIKNCEWCKEAKCRKQAFKGEWCKSIDQDYCDTKAVITSILNMFWKQEERIINGYESNTTGDK